MLELDNIERISWWNAANAISSGDPDQEDRARRTRLVTNKEGYLLPPGRALNNDLDPVRA